MCWDVLSASVGLDRQHPPLPPQVPAQHVPFRHSRHLGSSCCALFLVNSALQEVPRVSPLPTATPRWPPQPGLSLGWELSVSAARTDEVPGIPPRCVHLWVWVCLCAHTYTHAHELCSTHFRRQISQGSEVPWIDFVLCFGECTCVRHILHVGLRAR